MPNLLPKRPLRAPVNDPLSPGVLSAFVRRVDSVEGFWRDACASGASVPELPEGSELEDEADLPALEFVLHYLDGVRGHPGVALDSLDPAKSAEDIAQTLPSGRLLLCELNMSIADGVSQAASGGHFDERDLPPWPTWLVAYVRRGTRVGASPSECLVCWVPEDRVASVARGIDANRCDCLSWLEERDMGLAEQLRAAGFGELLPGLLTGD